MTLTAAPRKAGPFVGTGASVAYPYGFRIETAGDLRVYQDQDIVSPGFFSVSGVGNELGGEVTLTAALSSTVWIFGLLPIEQQDISLVPGGAISSSGIELEADKAVQRELEVQEQLERTLSFHQSTTLRNLELLEFSGQALKLFQINATEDNVVYAPSAILTVTPVAGGGAVVTAQATQAVNAADNALTLDTSGLVPAGARLTDGMAFLATAWSTERSITAWGLGTVLAPQRYGRNLAITQGTQTNAGAPVNFVEEPASSGLELRITAEAGGAFGLTGQAIVTASYLLYVPPQAVP